MEVTRAGGQLGDLGEAAGDGQARQGMPAQIFEHPAREVAHIDDGDVRQLIEPADTRLRGRAGAGRHMLEPVGAGNVDAPMDRGDPGRAGVGMHDAGRAEDRQPADDAEPSIPGLLRHLDPARHGDGDLHIGRPPMRPRQLFDHRAHHPPRHRIDGGLADGQGQSRLGDRADALTGPEPDPAAGLPESDLGENEGLMSHIGIVAGILDDAGHGGIGAQHAAGEGEAGPLAFGQHDLDGVREAAGQQCREGSLGRGRGAGACGPAAAQRSGGFAAHGAIVVAGVSKWLAARAVVSDNAQMVEVPMDLPRFEPGWVWLAGAGPGDPGLLTLLALHGLRQADAVVYDALVSTEILNLAAPGTLLEFAGKRGGKPSAKQPDISRRLVQLAREGRRVLRLKGGDPFIFGRGGEEALALVAAGVPFRIVPGVSAGIGGLAYAGIPITHRDVNSAVTFVTGHAASGVVPASVDWEALAKGSPVIVVYMALKHIAAIADRLLAAGRAPTEPVAVVSRATTAQQRVLETTLARAAADVEASGIEPPAVVAIGQAVTLRAGLDWLGALDGRVLDPDPLDRRQRSEAG